MQLKHSKQANAQREKTYLKHLRVRPELLIRLLTGEQATIETAYLFGKLAKRLHCTRLKLQ